MISLSSILALSLVIGTWVHNLDPVLWKIWGPLQLRWYGLAYLAGFVAAYLLLKRFARKGLWVLKEDAVPDFIAYGAMLGVFLGGRLGYVLFYMIPDQGIGSVTSDPGVIFRVWDGGMASHGGFLGLMLFTLVYARLKKLSWAGVGDSLVVVCPLGLLFGRVANFINGELYGRVADGVGWAVKFPSALFDSRAVESSRQGEVLNAINSVDPNAKLENVVGLVRDDPKLAEAVGPFLEPRHPSQLYEAFLEGAVLFAILYYVRVRFPNLAHGVLTGLFFILYAVFRIVVEEFREPDATWVIEDVLTKGQFYSIFMIGIGVAFLVYARIRGRQAADAAAKARG